MKIKLLVFAIVWIFFTDISAAMDTAERHGADEIIKKANHMALYQGDDMKGRVSMVITDRQGRSRTREFNILRKDSGESDSDQKFFVFFQAPADVRKMVFMVHKKSDVEKDDDRWLYMPGLDLVKRIAAGDKRTSFAGSDFLYEDISGRSPDEDVHELLRTTEKFYVIRNVPIVPGSVEFEHYVTYIDRSTHLPVKTEYFKSGGRLYRTIEAEGIENIRAGENRRTAVYPTVVRSVSRDLETGSKTVMTFSNIRYNTGVSDKIFTERYLRRPPRDVMR